MRKAFVVAVALGWMACGGEIGLEGSGGNGDDDNTVCYGDPDTGMVCVPRNELWDCTAMPNGDVKCTDSQFETPDGESGWTCSAEGDKIVCTKDEPDITGGSGWTCVSDGDSTTCTTSQSTTPTSGSGGGSSSWTCHYDDVLGLVCTTTPDSSSGGSSSGLPGDDSSSGGSSSGLPGDDSSPPGDDSGDSGGGTTGVPPFPCSYAMVVFIYGGQTYVMKIPQGWTTCTFTNITSSDANFSYTCNGTEYSNPGFVFSADGSPVPTYTGQLACSDLFTVAGVEVWAKAGVTIIYAAAHNGSFENHFVSQCPPPGGVTYMSFPIECNP
jgi:hypothetical protein